MRKLVTSKLVTSKLVTSKLKHLLPVAALALQCPAHADIEEIVVTADFRGAAELATPNSVTVVTDEVIDALAAQQLEDIVGSIPNLNLAGGTGRARFFQIRGIGERSQFVDPINPSVGLLVDGVDFSGIGSAATLFDVSQVEVLRGPQGTRYGAGALAGLINITTRAPTATFTGSARAGVAQYNTRTLGGTLSGPLGDTTGFRLAAQQNKSDGYTNNAFLGANDVNSRDELTMRARFTFEPSENSRTNLSLMWIDIDNGYDAFSLDNTRITLSDEPGHDRQKTLAGALDSLFNLGAFDVHLLASHADSDLDYGYDEDWTYAGIDPIGYSSFDDYIRHRKTTSVEARLVSSESNRILGGTTDWVIGLYGLDSVEGLRRQYTFLPSDFTSDYDFTTLATYLQLDTSLNDRLTLSSGVRFENRRSNYVDSAGTAFSPDENLWGGQLSLNFMTNDIMTYVSLARGYKAGGFNTDGTLDPDLREFDSEFLWELETGVKGTLLDGRLLTRAAIFYDIRRDQQVKSSIVRVRADGSTEFIDFVGNAAEGTNIGAEFEGDWYISDTLSLFASAGLLRARFDKFINEFGADLSGRDQAQAPSYMFNVGVNYASDAWFARIAIEGKDAYYFSDRHNVRSTRNTLLTARVGYRTRDWSLSLWGRNLTDQDYTIRGFGSFGNDPRKGYIVEPYVQYGEPRIVGATFEIFLE